MPQDERHVLARVPAGSGLALDLGGDRSQLRTPLERRGYRYVNLDTRPSGMGWKVRGDAHRLPFRPGRFSIVVCNEALTGLPDPQRAFHEVRRVLPAGGQFVFWALFTSGVGDGNDYVRFTPDGIRVLLERSGFRLVSIEAPLRIFSFLAEVLVAAFQRIGFRSVERPIRRAGELLDRLIQGRGSGLALAVGYVVVARATGPDPAEES
jgi:SAM-dependent methyltransferase